MQFSGHNCVKQNKSPLPLGHHLSSLLRTCHQISVTSVDRCGYFQHCHWITVAFCWASHGENFQRDTFYLSENNHQSVLSPYAGVRLRHIKPWLSNLHDSPPNSSVMFQCRFEWLTQWFESYRFLTEWLAHIAHGNRRFVPTSQDLTSLGSWLAISKINLLYYWPFP